MRIEKLQKRKNAFGPLLLSYRLEPMEIFLESTFKLFPDKCGLIFQKSYLGETIFEDEDQTEDDLWEFFWHLSIVLRSLSNYPLLHKMCIHGYDEYLSLFARNLPTLKSQQGDDSRSFHQTVLEYFPNRLQLADISLRELENCDPVTGFCLKHPISLFEEKKTS